MGRKVFILLAVILLAGLMFPGKAYAWSNLNVEVRDSLTHNLWQHDCDVVVVGAQTGEIYADVSGACNASGTNGQFSIPIPGPYSNANGTDQQLNIVISLIDPDDPNQIIRVLPAQSFPAVDTTFDYPADPPFGPGGFWQIFTGYGPSTVEISTFTANDSVSAWLPFAVLLPSLALISGSINLLRKRKNA